MLSLYSSDVATSSVIDCLYHEHVLLPSRSQDILSLFLSSQPNSKTLSQIPRRRSSIFVTHLVITITTLTNNTLLEAFPPVTALTPKKNLHDDRRMAWVVNASLRLNQSSFLLEC